MRTRLRPGQPTASWPKLGLDAKGLRAFNESWTVTDYLVSLGIPREELDHIDTLVNFDFERSTPAGFRCHVFGAPESPGHLIEVAEGLLVVDETMALGPGGLEDERARAAGIWLLNLRPIPFESSVDRRLYRDGAERYTVADLIAYCKCENLSCQGAIRAAAVFKRVHDGVRAAHGRWPPQSWL